MTDDLPDWFSPGFVAVRRALRELWDKYPEAFPEVMRMTGARETQWRKMLPPIEKGDGDKVLQATRETRAWLLADYRRRGTTSREKFCADLVGERYGHRYFVGKFKSEDAVLWHLKEALKLARNDPHFKREVEEWEMALGEVATPPTSRENKNE